MIVGWRLSALVPVVVAANRDELLARPTDPPLLLAEDPPRWGGRDRLAGGTWLAVDPDGRVAAVTNRHPGGRPPGRDSTRRSRGVLPLEALRGSDAEARTWASGLDERRFNPVNLVYASPTDAWCVSMDDEGGRRVTDLEPGVHVLTEQDVDDPSDAKTQAILAAATAAWSAVPSAEGLIERWREILRSHGATYAGSPACIHGDTYGTVSSATVQVEGSPGGWSVRYDHAEGPPCRTPFRPVL